MQLWQTEVISTLCERHEVTEWIKECLGVEDPTPRPIALNFLSDLLFSNIPKENVEEILDELNKHIHRRKQSGNNKLHDVVATFGQECPKMLCNGRKVEKSDEILLRIMDIEDILAYNLKYKFFVYLNDEISTDEGRDIFMRIHSAIMEYGKGQIRDSDTATRIVNIVKRAHHSCKWCYPSFNRSLEVIFRNCSHCNIQDRNEKQEEAKKWNQEQSMKRKSPQSG